MIHKRHSGLQGSDGNAHLQRDSQDSAHWEGRTDLTVVQGAVKYGYHRETFLNDSEDLTEGQEKVVEASSEGVRPKMPTQVQNSEVREGRQVKETPDQAVLSPGQAAGGTQAEGECQSSVPEDPKGPLVTTDYDKDFPIYQPW